MSEIKVVTLCMDSGPFQMFLLRPDADAIMAGFFAKNLPPMLKGTSYDGMPFVLDSTKINVAYTVPDHAAQEPIAKMIELREGRRPPSAGGLGNWFRGRSGVN